MRRFEANDILSLTEETPRYDLAESVGPDLLLGRLLDGGLDDLPLGYGTAQGDPALRAQIAEAHDVSTDDVVLMVGGMHALFLTGFLLCGRGEPSVTTTPVFPNTLTALRAVGSRVALVRQRFEDAYALDLDAFRAALSPETRLALLTSPQNPSGVAIPGETLEAALAMMAEICPDAFLLVDETYRDAAYGDDPVAPSAVHLSPKVISVASLSKCHGAPALRLGWAITRDPALREQLILGKFNTVICCSAVDEALARRALERREPILAERRRHLSEGLACVETWVAAQDGLVDWLRPDAGALCAMRLAPARFDDEAVERFWAAQRDAGVRVGAGAWFGDEARVFRLGFGLLDIPDLEAGMAALSVVLRAVATRDG